MKEKCTIQLGTGVPEFCISRHEALSQKAFAKKDNKIEAGILAESEVVEYGVENWKRLNDFVSKRQIRLSSDQRMALSIAVQIPRKIPTSFQAKLLLGLREAMLGEGFKKFDK